MSLTKVNRKLPEDGKYAVGPFNLQNGEVGSMVRNLAIRSKIFTFSLEDTTAVATAYADGDNLVELGELDVDDLLPEQTGDYAATRILIKSVTVNVITAAGQTLVGNLRVSATSGTATNAALTSGTEIAGAGATYKDEDGASLAITESDFNLNSVDLTHVSPRIDVPIASKNLYLCTTTAVNADITAGRGVVVVEYEVV